MAVLFWYARTYRSSDIEANTGHIQSLLRFTKYQKHTAMYNWSPYPVVRTRGKKEKKLTKGCQCCLN